MIGNGRRTLVRRSLSAWDATRRGFTGGSRAQGLFPSSGTVYPILVSACILQEGRRSRDTHSVDGLTLPGAINKPERPHCGPAIVRVRDDLVEHAEGLQHPHGIGACAAARAALNCSRQHLLKDRLLPRTRSPMPTPAPTSPYLDCRAEGYMWECMQTAAPGSRHSPLTRICLPRSLPW